MIKVAIESPLAGNFARNLRYARFCALDCIRKNENPYASHLFFTQFLNDATPEERERGLSAGLEWAALADLRVFYEDLGWSSGMMRAYHECERTLQRFELRRLPKELWEAFERGDAPGATEGAVTL